MTLSMPGTSMHDGATTNHVCPAPRAPCRLVKVDEKVPEAGTRGFLVGDLSLVERGRGRKMC